MASLPVVFDISSDDEPSPDDIGGAEDLGWAEPKYKDEDWLSTLLEVAEKHSNDSDEVVVIGEFKPTRKISKSTPCKTMHKDSDDDCVILDGDPDHAVTNLNDSSEGSDEILIVAEKGQIACRDYPHPRHLCARFLFISTPHEKHCDLCHCYVCDVIAPCPFWHGGFSLADHCHATDKEPAWKEQRISFRKGNQGSLSIALPQVTQHLHHDPIQIMMTNQASQSNIMQHCSSNNVAPHRLAPSSENMFQMRQASHQHPKVKNRALPRSFRKLIQTNKGNSFSNLPSKFVTSSTMFKRTGSVGGAAQFNRFPSNAPYVVNPPSIAHPLTVSGFGDASACYDSMHPLSYSGSYSSPLKTTGHSFPPINGSEILQGPQQRKDDSNWSSVQQENSILSVNNNMYQQGTNHNSFQHENQIEDASDLSFDWLSDYSLSNQPSLPGSCQIIVSESEQGCLANAQAPVNVEHDTVVVENQAVPPGQDWLRGLNILSPPPTNPDADSIVFDFETSWNGLGEV